MNFERIMQLTIVVIVLVVVSLLVTTSLNPANVINEELPELLDNPIAVMYENIPCRLNCLTQLQGDEVSELSRKPFDIADGSDVLIEWFPCNQEIMTLAYMINEMVKFKEINFELVRKESVNYFSDSKSLMYKCLTCEFGCGECTNNLFVFSNFCDEDDYLYNYEFLPCSSIQTFRQMLNRNYFEFYNREGKDIANDFVCDRSIGDSYNPPYSLCVSDPSEKYDVDNCKPSWLLIKEQELDTLTGAKATSKGRCEDFALLYYSLFRAIDVPASDMSLNLGVCELPCPCKQLLKEFGEDLGLDYFESKCFAPSVFNLDSTHSINGCDEKTIRSPDYYGGEFYITQEAEEGTYHWLVNQSFVKAPAYRDLTFDADYSNDEWRMSLNYDDVTETYTSSNILDKSFKTSGELTVGVRQSFSLTQSVDKLYGLRGVFGFTIKITGLTNCENDQVFVQLGYTDSINRTTYTMVYNEERGVSHDNLIYGAPFFVFWENSHDPEADLEDCVVDYEITPSTAGLIVKDPCYSYPGKSEGQTDEDYKNQLLTECAYFIDDKFLVTPTGSTQVSDKDFIDI